MISDEDIQRYLFLLEQSSSNDDKSRSDAEAEIEDNVANDILKVVFTLSEIILKDDIDYPLVYLALVNIRKIFTPFPPITEEDISKDWLDVDSSDRDKVKAAIMRGLMFPDPQIVSITALTFSALLNIEKTNMFDLIPRLYEIFESSEYSELTKAATINVLAEISSPKSLGGHTETEEVQNILSDIFVKIGSYFSESAKLSLDIRYNLSNAIDTFLDVAVPLFQGEDTIHELIELVLENLDNIPKDQPENAIARPDQLNFKLLSILFKIIKIHYENEEFNPEKIFKYTIQQIQNYSNPSIDQDIISNYIIFWTMIADFERDIIKRNVYKENLNRIMDTNYRNKRFQYEISPNTYREFSSIAIEELTEKLVHIMLMIDPQDPDAEDVTNKMPHMFATCCLQSFFKIDPDSIYEKIITYWSQDMGIYYQEIYKQQEENPGSDFIPPQAGLINWINDHTLLLTISVFCRKTIVPNQIIRQLHTFFFEPFEGNFVILRDYILGTCLNFCEIPKIIDTCLFSLSLIFERYPEFLREEVFEIIFNWIKENMEIRDPIIFMRIVNLVCTIYSRKIASRLSPEVKAKLLESFNDFYNLFKIGISRPDSIQEDIYRFSYIMMSNILQFTLFAKHFMNIDNDNNIAKLIQDQLNIMRESCQFNEDSYNSIRIGQVIFIFNSIYSINGEYTNRFQDYLDPIIEVYSKIMNPNSPVFEDGLIGFENVIRCMGKDKIELLNRINNVVNIGLQSYSPSIITRSAYLRAALYEKFITNQFPTYDELLESFPSNYEMIVNDCLSNESFTREYYPYLLKALALIISACSEYIRDEHPESIDEFITEYDKFASMPISVEEDNIDDIDYANIFYDSMFTFSSAIMKCISENSDLRTDRKFRKLMSESIAPSYLTNLEFHFADNSIIAFCNFLNQFNETFGRKGNILINRQYNFIILFHGINSKNKKVSEKAKQTLEMVKHA